MDPLAPVVDALLTSVPVDLATEESSIALIVRHRWPDALPPCPRIRCASRRALVGCHLRCPRCGRGSTIFVDTPLARLRRPRVRALLLALRAIAIDKRGIAARALARTEGLPHVTLWRHIHELRALLAAPADPTPPAGSVQVCGRRGPATPASLVVSRAQGAYAVNDGDHMSGTRSPVRLVGETVRTWLNGTFHGVSRRWLPRYLLEATARLNCTARQILEHFLHVLDVS